MSESAGQGGTPVREAVASFATRDQFRDAVSQLLAAGFAASDLSVLASHQSLEIAGFPGTPGQGLVAGLTDEVNFLDPLTVAGFSMVSAGPVAALIAAIVGAGLSGVAVKEVLDRLTANRHGTEFAAALEAGAVLLWVRTANGAQDQSAAQILGRAGGQNVHVNERN